MCSVADAMRGCSARSRSARPVAPPAAQRMNSSTAASNDSVRDSTSSRSAFQDANPCSRAIVDCASCSARSDRAGCYDARSLRRIHPSALDANLDAFGAAFQCCPVIAITNAAKHESTFNMGRRIMAERGRRQRRRTRRIAPDARRDTAAAVDGRTDAALRAFVRVLARQAAREVFESELRRTTSSVH